MSLQIYSAQASKREKKTTQLYVSGNSVVSIELAIGASSRTNVPLSEVLFWTPNNASHCCAPAPGMRLRGHRHCRTWCDDAGYAHRLQSRALHLFFSVALDRLPVVALGLRTRTSLVYINL